MCASGNRVIVIDDLVFGSILVEALADTGYEAVHVRSVDEAVHHIWSNGAPRFILSDRQLDGEPVENSALGVLQETAPGSFIIVYTKMDELPPETIYALLDRGALRVINRDRADKIAGNIKLLTHEFDELLELSQALRSAGLERRKIAAALVGTGVGVTVIDRNCHCWYANSTQQQLTGMDSTDGMCWRLFHGHPVAVGPCWGCTVSGFFDESVTPQYEQPVERLFLSRFANGKVTWVWVHSTPILSEETQKPIAVREGVLEATPELVASLNFEQRTQRIAQGLVHLGFGRARIYDVRHVKQWRLIAAASCKDPVGSPQSAYLQSLSEQGLANIAIDDRKCPHIARAHGERVGFVITQADGDAKQIFAEQLDIRTPTYAIPVWSGDETTLNALMLMDFEGKDVSGLEAAMDHMEHIGLRALQDGYATEVRKAFDASGSPPEEQDRYQIVQHARLAVGTARSVAEATTILSDAFCSLVSGCRISTRILDAAGLRRHEALSVGDKPAQVPITIEMSDPMSLAARVVDGGHAIWIDDYAEYRDTASLEGKPLGHVDPGYGSTAHIPLVFEGTLLGTLSIDSPRLIRWAVEGYAGPLVSLSELCALVVRDVILNEQVERATADRAAIIAYALTASDDALWRHWSIQQLSEVHAQATRGQMILAKTDLKAAQKLEKLSPILRAIDEGLSTVSKKKVPKQKSEMCSLDSVVSKLEKKYETQRNPVFRFPVERPLPRLKVPEFLVRHLLQILLDNARQAIQSAGKGNRVDVTVSRDGGFTLIHVSDDGPGIPHSLRDRIFKEPIESGKGSGVGLLIARGIAVQYQGDLLLVPNDSGAHFVVRLPTVAKANHGV